MEDRKIIIEKRIECIIGILFLIPPILGAIAFTLQLFEANLGFSTLSNLTIYWTGRVGQGGGMSAAPIYMALMAFVGAYLIKDKLRYLIPDKKEQKEVN